MTELDAVIRIMGKPEEFGESRWRILPQILEKEEIRGLQYIKTGKRSFRDPDNKVVGGVCSGIGPISASKILSDQTRLWSGYRCQWFWCNALFLPVDCSAQS